MRFASTVVHGLVALCLLFTISTAAFSASHRRLERPPNFHPIKGESRSQSAERQRLEYREWQKAHRLVPSSTISIDPSARSSAGLVFYDDMESGLNGWTVDTHADTMWHQTTTKSNSPTHSWWLGIEGTGTYSNLQRIDQSLVSPPIDLTGIIPPAGISLMFAEWYETEARWDRCMLEVSANGGLSWDLLGEHSGYSDDWEIQEYDLSEYAGSTINIRFHMDTQDSLFNSHAGWFIDNVMVFSGAGQIGGQVYLDLNQNGNRDNLDAPLDNWPVTATGSGITVSTTTWSGWYQFYLPTGTYTVSSPLSDGWTRIAPASGTWNISAENPGFNIDTADFSYWRQASLIGGTVFSDSNQNGIRDDGEALVPYQPVILTQGNGDSHRLYTNGSGYYAYYVLDTGSYTVRQPVSEYKFQTLPQGGQPYSLTIVDLTSQFTDLHFGNSYSTAPPQNANCTITGAAYDDLNKNGVRDEHESPLAGITVRIDGTESRETVTDSVGLYSFEKLYPGSYSVRQALIVGRYQSQPAGDAHEVTLISGATAQGVDFGSYLIGKSRASGFVISDVNRNGVIDPSEPAVSGYDIALTGTTIYGQPVQMSTTTDNAGAFSFDSLWPGGYTISAGLRDRWVQTLPPSLQPYNTGIGPEANASGFVFGIHYDSTFSTSYLSFIPESIALAKDRKGLKWGPVKGYLIGASFTAQFVNATGLPASELHISVKLPITDTLTVTQAAWQTFNDTRRTVVITFDEPVEPVDTVTISGRAISPGKGVQFMAGTPVWVANGSTIPAPALSFNSTRLYMQPNVADLLMTMNLPVRVGLPVAHSVYMRKYMDIGKSLYDHLRMHSGPPRCLDVIDATQRPFRKTQAILPARVHDNKLFSEAVALRINILASDRALTPRGFGDLIFDDGDTTNGCRGKSVRFIAAKLDSFMSSYNELTGHAYCSMPSGLETMTPADLWRTVRMIDSAFVGPIDYLTYVPKGMMYLNGVRSLDEVPYLHIDTTLWSTRGLPPVIALSAAEPERFALQQNYPNPFNPTTTIAFTLPQSATVTLTVYNTLGQTVATLLNKENLEDGYQEVEFDASNFASGVYFYRIDATTNANPDEGIGAQHLTSVRKMMLVK